MKFDESHIYKNFALLVKVYDIISKKFEKSFGKINKNNDYISFQIFSTSDFVANTFLSQQALSEFYVLKELFNERAASFVMSPSA